MHELGRRGGGAEVQAQLTKKFSQGGFFCPQLNVQRGPIVVVVVFSKENINEACIGVYQISFIP